MKFRVYNGFGIKPTKSYAAAGWDFYVPDVTDESKQGIAIEALKKSYKKTDKDIATISARFEEIREKYPAFGLGKLDWAKQWVNVIHLFLAVDGSIMRASQNKVMTFAEYYLTITDDGIPGIRLRCNDHVFFNSGIKVALDHGVAGIFLNKSGRGLKGFDTRAQVVDEDYTGYVHLSQAFTKDNISDGAIFVGDKITQMLLIPLAVKDECEELDGDTYDEVMKDAARGADGFGSTDVKR